MLNPTKRIRGPAPTFTVRAAAGWLRRTAALTPATTTTAMSAIAKTYFLFLYHTACGTLLTGTWAMRKVGL